MDAYYTLSDLQWLFVWWAYGFLCVMLGYWLRGECYVIVTEDGSNKLHYRSIH